jgi:hypothetical protein
MTRHKNSEDQISSTFNSFHYNFFYSPVVFIFILLKGPDRNLQQYLDSTQHCWNGNCFLSLEVFFFSVFICSCFVGKFLKFYYRGLELVCNKIWFSKFIIYKVLPKYPFFLIKWFLSLFLFLHLFLYALPSNTVTFLKCN